MSGIWLGYVDYTLDTQEAFYVGKGREQRVRVLKRNHKHQFISMKHGIRREVVVCSLDEKWIIRWEVETIASLHTYVKDSLSSRLACNESAGGEGRSRPRFPEPKDRADEHRLVGLDRGVGHEGSRMGSDRASGAPEEQEAVDAPRSLDGER